MANSAVDAAGPVVEKFAGSAGRWLGYFGMAIGVVGIVLLVLDGAAAWRGTAVCFAVALLSWVVLVRPAVAIHAHGVLLKNLARDAFIPSGTIDRCRSSQTLMIRAGDRTFHGLSVGRSARSVMRERRKAISPGGISLLGPFGGGSAAIGMDEAGHEHTFAQQEVAGSNYADYVATRIEQLRHDAPDAEVSPVTAWSTDGLAAVALAVALTLAAIFG